MRRFPLLLLAALALLAVGASAAVQAPPREIASQQPRHADASAAIPSASPSSCGAHEHMLVVSPADASFWLALPLTSSNRWLSVLPSNLQAELDRQGVQQVAVMCVPHEQRDAVQQQLAAMSVNSDNNADFDEQQQQDAPSAAEPADSEPTDERYLRLKALQQRFSAVLANIKAKRASEVDVSELGAIVAGLESEFASYPADMQAEVRESKEGLVRFISKVQADLKAKLANKSSKAIKKADDSDAETTDLDTAAVDEKESQATVLSLLSSAESSFSEALEAAQRSSDRRRGDRDDRRRRRGGRRGRHGSRDQRGRRPDDRRRWDVVAADGELQNDLLLQNELENELAWNAAAQAEAQAEQQLQLDSGQLSNLAAASDEQLQSLDERAVLLRLAQMEEQMEARNNAELGSESNSNAELLAADDFESTQFLDRRGDRLADRFADRRGDRFDERRRDDRLDERRRGDRFEDRRGDRFDDRRRGDRFDDRRRGDRFEDRRRGDRFADGIIGDIRSRIPFEGIF